MNVKIIGIFAVIILVVIAGMGLMATSDPTHESDAWDGDDNTNTDDDSTDGTWVTQLSVKLKDGTIVPIPIDGNALQTAPLSVSYGGQEIQSIIYGLRVTAEDPEGYYTTVDVRPSDTPKVRMAMIDGSGSSVHYEHIELYPFDMSSVPVDGVTRTLKLVEFNISAYNQAASAGTYTMWLYVTGGDFQYKLPDQTAWTTCADPTDIFFDVTVSHGDDFSVSFSASSTPPN